MNVHEERADESCFPFLYREMRIEIFPLIAILDSSFLSKLSFTYAAYSMKKVE